MSWLNMWDSLKTKTCRYLLQRYLGKYFVHKLNLEQLKIDLYNGKAVINNVLLKIDVLNELFESQGWSVEVLSGHIGSLTVTVPWNALMTNDSLLEISDLTITLRPIKRQQNGASMLESMWSSVSSSMQMAEECMKQSEDDIAFEIHNNSVLVGLEKFAETIDNVLNRIHAKCTNAFINIEHNLMLPSKKITLAIKIDRIDYKNETGREIDVNMANRKFYDSKIRNDDYSQSNNLLPSVAKHTLSLRGIVISTIESDNLFTSYKPKINYECKLESFPSNYVYGAQMLPIVIVKGQQNIEIKIKQTENIEGPKVGLNIEIDSIYAIFTPRQIHLINKIINAFSEGDSNEYISNEENVGPKQEHNVLQADSSFGFKMTGAVSNNDVWCSGDYDGTCTSSPTLGAFDPSTNSTKENSLRRSFSTNSTITTCGKNKSLLESSGEIVNFKIQIASIVAISLHNDAEEINMEFLENFFLHIGNLDREKIYLQLGKISNKNHLYFETSPLFINGTQQRKKHILFSKVIITTTKLDISEVLSNSTKPLILFDREKSSTNGYINKPEVTIELKSSFSTTPKIYVYNNIDVSLERCTVEMDISIYDRLSALFVKSPFSRFDESVEKREQKSKNGFTKISVTSRSLRTHLRFPVIDVRSSNDVQETSWCEQNIRDDFLVFVLEHFVCTYSHQSFVINTNGIDIYYCSGNKSNLISILQGKSLDTTSFPLVAFELNMEATEKHRSALPFSSKYVSRQSDTAHSNLNEPETEVYLLPGDTSEIEEFCAKTMKTSEVKLKITVPTIIISLESKQLYEILYNRLNNDLFMWEACSPLFDKKLKFKKSLQNILSKQCNTNDKTYMDSQEVPIKNIETTKFVQDLFSNKMKLNIDDIPRHTEESIYHSTSENILDDKYQEVIQENRIRQFSSKINIHEGTINLWVPVKDMENKVSPKQCGKIQCTIGDLKIFLVNGFNNDGNLSYTCLQLNELNLLHCGLEPADVSGNLSDVPVFMKPTLYNKPQLNKSLMETELRKEIVCLVLEMKKNPEQRIKRMKLTAGIKNAILRHNSEQSSHMWLNQLRDFFDILEYPVAGFNPFALLTEIQLHFWDCAIDYRPKFLPYRAFVDIGTFSISTNMASSASGCSLRFTADDCQLSIAPFDSFAEEKQNYECNILDLKKLVSVVQLGLLDISLRWNKEVSAKFPKIDVRSSVHDMHLKTCSDSGRAFAQLLAYIASDRDIASHNNCKTPKVDVLKTSSINKDFETNDHKQQRFKTMMAEAMQDVSAIKSSELGKGANQLNDSENKCFDEFFFPDENFGKQHSTKKNISDDFKAKSNVMLNSYFTAKKKSTIDVAIPSNEEKDYFFITDMDKKNMNQFGLKNVQTSKDPLQIIDNHFCLQQPKTDLLHTPNKYPVPEHRYTLCEMTFTWHIFGGSDFNIDGLEKPKCNLQQMSNTYKYGVSQHKNEVYSSGANIRGRNKDVLVEIQFTKIRFSHEIYDESLKYTSRQVLLISDIEIRDRLISSEINKFLYHPSVRNFTNKSEEYMAIIKAISTRSKVYDSTPQECSLKISLLPIKLNIDQGTLLFLEEFFSDLVHHSEPQHIEKMNNDQKQSIFTKEEIAPVFNINDDFLDCDLQMDEQNIISNNMGKTDENKTASDLNIPIFFREVIFSPAVPICLDYHGRKIELSRGPVTGLIMGLAQLQGSGICLRELINRRGLLGWDKLFEYLLKEWLKDIKRNQLPKILSGIGPTNAVLQIFQGVYDLFWMPIEQYQRDRRIIRGFQLGAQSFSARTAFAALEITSKIINLLQLTAETAFDMLSAGPTKKSNKMKSGKKRPNRPKDLREGVTNALVILKEGINDSASDLIETALIEHDQKGYTGAVGAVMRQIPQLVVCPAVLATQATTNILGGAKSSLVPDAKLEAREKWKETNS